jgi:hypothetical protein
MIVNALLVCWNGGWFRLDDPAAISAAGYRAEGFLSLGAQYDEGEAYRQAQQVLADYRETRVGIETRIDPAPPGQGAAAPYQGWRPTNTINVAGQTHRVRSMRVQLTDDGPEFTPGFGRRAPSESDRLVTAVKKFSPGVMAGDTAIPTPMSPYSAGAETETVAGGNEFEMFAVEDEGEAVLELLVVTPVTCFVTASVSTVVWQDPDQVPNQFSDPGLTVLFPVGAEQPTSTIVGPAAVLSSVEYTNLQNNSQAWHVTASITFATTFTAAGPGFVGAVLRGDNPAFNVKANIMVCPSTGQDTLDRISVA